jgi:hypothetical protein
MKRERQEEFIKKAGERHEAFWTKLLSDPKFVEQLRRYDSEIEKPLLKNSA